MTPSEAFTAFLAALRTSGSSVPLSDQAVAHLLIAALDVVQPDNDDAAETATTLSIDLESLAEGGYFRRDNGSNPEDDNGNDDE